MLKVKSEIVSEGEDIIATCSAPEETGSLMFYFYETDQEVKRVVSTNNSVTTSLTLQKLKDNYLYCDYIVVMQHIAGHSNKSKIVKVIVKGKCIFKLLERKPFVLTKITHHSLMDLCTFLSK